MHISWKHLAIGLAILPIVAVFGAWIGFFNIGASTGHWPITNWFLHFAMESAVRTYSIGIDAPPLDDPDMLQPAAGHFATGCAICHGAPGEPRSPAVLAMLPQPPDLVDIVDKWDDAELYRIVKHGVRFSGMPAWPTQERPDEVWAMVAFLRALPGMDVASYRELAYGESQAGAQQTASATTLPALADCARCHGEDGQGRSHFVPVIAGQSEAYLLESLSAYAEGRRESAFMALPAKAAAPEEWVLLARHYASQPKGAATTDAGPAELVQAGQDIAERGVPNNAVPACLSCHGVNPRNPVFPKLEGQHAAYLEAQLRFLRSGTRGGTHFSHLMANAAKGLTDDDISAAAAYFASQPPALP